MRNSTNYSLLLPDETDFYSVHDMNANTEIIDERMKSNQTKVDAVTTSNSSHIASKSNPHGVTKEQIGLGNVPNVATNNQTPTYTVSANLSNLASGEVLSTAFGKLSKAVSDLISHIGNKSNPHAVTKAQIGLDSVPNVSTNDQTPTYSDTTTLATLTSGEKLNVALQKTKLAITTLINHIGNNVMHITSAERSSWNAKADGTLLHSRIPQYYNVKTQAELDSVMNGHSTNLAINTYYNFTLSVATSNLSILGGTYYVEGMKTSAEYEWQRMTKYPNGADLPPLLMMGRSKFAGTWTSWVNIATQSETSALQTALGTKVDKVSGKALSTNDYTTAEKTKLSGIAAGAQVNSITGVKGNAETEYRTGQVNITPANIGLGNVNNTADSAKSVAYATNAGGVAWTNVTGKPSTYPASSHTHDDRYYTEAEVDTMMTQKVHIGLFANNRLSLQWVDSTSKLKAFIDGVEIGNVTIVKD